MFFVDFTIDMRYSYFFFYIFFDRHDKAYTIIIKIQKAIAISSFFGYNYHNQLCVVCNVVAYGHKQHIKKEKGR